MQEIKCPKCGEFFQVDESGYAAIVQQVRDAEFEKELKERNSLFEREKLDAIALAKTQAESSFKEVISQKDLQISQLSAQITQEQSAKTLAVAEALRQKDAEIAALKAKIEAGQMDKELAVNKAVAEKEQTIGTIRQQVAVLQGEVENTKKEGLLQQQSQKDHYEQLLKSKDEEIAHYRDFKARLSTKMVGESLEQHCEISFNQLRMTAFPNACFGKDNDAKSGSKGDYIYRESYEGTEFISIMFEMKNEMENTVSKKKNEDFFKELDKDRNEKGCEYAVLVSLLEPDNDFYNNGIVDVSYKYPKMYVIRPQFFIPMITLLRNAARNALQYRKELEIVKNQNLDISNFENKINDFKDKFAYNYRLASEKFKKAIEEIDKSIAALQKTKDNLISSENQLRLANDKAEDLTIKRLTYNNPTMKKMFGSLHEEDKQ